MSIGLSVKSVKSDCQRQTSVSQVSQIRHIYLCGGAKQDAQQLLELVIGLRLRHLVRAKQGREQLLQLIVALLYR